MTASPSTEMAFDIHASANPVPAAERDAILANPGRKKRVQPVAPNSRKVPPSLAIKVPIRPWRRSRRRVSSAKAAAGGGGTP